MRREGGIGISLSDEVFEYAERRGAKTARVAAAGKLLTVCCSVLRNCRPYFNPFTLGRSRLLVDALTRGWRAPKMDERGTVSTY